MNEIIYQIFPQTFKDGNNAGSGNLKGITEKLAYLSWLGITRLWISPFCLSPFKDSGYDVQDYLKIDPQFGNMSDFNQLVKTAKKYNISLIMDMVFNHTSSQHEWFQKALRGDKKYQNYYIFRKPVNGQAPTNWKSKMGGSCWEYVSDLDKYYLHLFAIDQPDLNWRNPEVKEELFKVLNFWLAKGVDGFRLDVCNLYDKPEEFINDDQGDGRRFYTDGKLISKYFNEMYKNAFIKSKTCFTIGEVSSTTKEISANYAKKNSQQLSSIFTFLHLKVDYKNNFKWTYMEPDMVEFKSILREWQLYFQQENSQLALFLNNHDQARSVSRFGDVTNYHFSTATCLFLTIAFLNGVPVIYQGEEIGMTNYPFQKLEDFWDVETIGNMQDLLTSKQYPKEEIFKILNSKAREHARTVMQWNDDKNAGFSNSNHFKLKINSNYKVINVEQQKEDQKSILWFYKKAIQLRKENEIIQRGHISFINSQELFIYQKTLNGESIIVISNLSPNFITDKVTKQFRSSKILFSNYETNDLTKIKPFEVLILKLNENVEVNNND